MCFLIINIKNLWMDVWCSAVCFVLIDCIWPIKLGEAEEYFFSFWSAECFKFIFNFSYWWRKCWFIFVKCVCRNYLGIFNFVRLSFFFSVLNEDFRQWIWKLTAVKPSKKKCFFLYAWGFFLFQNKWSRRFFSFCFDITVEKRSFIFFQTDNFFFFEDEKKSFFSFFLPLLRPLKNIEAPLFFSAARFFWSFELIFSSVFQFPFFFRQPLDETPFQIDFFFSGKIFFTFFFFYGAIFIH